MKNKKILILSLVLTLFLTACGTKNKEKIKETVKETSSEVEESTNDTEETEETEEETEEDYDEEDDNEDIKPSKLEYDTRFTNSKYYLTKDGNLYERGSVEDKLFETDVKNISNEETSFLLYVKDNNLYLGNYKRVENFLLKENIGPVKKVSLLKDREGAAYLTENGDLYVAGFTREVPAVIERYDSSIKTNPSIYKDEVKPPFYKIKENVKDYTVSKHILLYLNNQDELHFEFTEHKIVDKDVAEISPIRIGYDDSVLVKMKDGTVYAYDNLHNAHDYPDKNKIIKEKLGKTSGSLKDSSFIDDDGNLHVVTFFDDMRLELDGVDMEKQKIPTNDENREMLHFIIKNRKVKDLLRYYVIDGSHLTRAIYQLEDGTYEEAILSTGEFIKLEKPDKFEEY